MDNAPCKDCPDRVVEPNCHMTCEKYIAFQEMCRERIKAREYEREYKQYRFMLNERVDRANRKMKSCHRYRNRMD